MHDTLPKVITFGCRLNTYESERIRQRLVEQKAHDIIVVNTCAVTAEAERQARQMIRRLKKENPESRIVVTGCSATINQKMYESMDEVSSVVVNEQKENLELFLPAGADSLPVFNHPRSDMLSGFEGRARAFLQVQMGCDHYCSFCVIHIARGPSKSVPFEQILQQAQIFADQGFREINLTGVDICSFRDGELTLGKLVLRLLEELPEQVCLRLSSLDPAAIDEALYQALENPRLLPHWHLSIQSGDDTILRKMIRRHTAADVYTVIEKARTIRPDMVFGSDFIVGFPQETEDMFLNTCQLVEECRIALLHIFPYSDRPGTAALTLTPKIPHVIQKERLHTLSELGQKILHTVMQAALQSPLQGLIEKVEDNRIIGKTGQFLPFCIPITQTHLAPGERVNFLAQSIIQQGGKDILSGELI